MGSKPRLTFSSGRRWSARCAVLISSVCVLAIAAMVNYASQRYFSKRMFLSTQTEVELSGQTLGLLGSLTNDVEMILYYDREDVLFPTVSALVNEYRLACSKIRVRTVDYFNDPAEAAQIKIEYGLSALQEKNLVIFDSGGRAKIVPGTMLAEYSLERVPNAEEMEFFKKPVLFKGEQVFSAVILAIVNPKPLKAYFITGHGEHPPAGGDEQMGYLKFSSLLQHNYVEVHSLSLLGTNQVPDDCNLLILAGPVQPLVQLEMQRIAAYLDQGGRFLAMVNYQSVARSLGIEPVLEQWGVEIGSGLVRDPENTLSGTDIVSSEFGEHAIMNPLLESRVHFILPRPVGLVSTNEQTADAPLVDVLAYSGPKSFLMETAPGIPTAHPLAVAVERAEAPGVVTERGTTRIVVLGDSILFGNQLIESAANHDFANAIVSWLTDRTALLQGVGPKQITEYRVLMTDAQFMWFWRILLVGLPVSVLALGGVVWLVRRR